MPSFPLILAEVDTVQIIVWIAAPVLVIVFAAIKALSEEGTPEPDQEGAKKSPGPASRAADPPQSRSNGDE